MAKDCQRMRKGCVLVLVSIVSLTNVILGVRGWEGKAAVKSTSVARRHVFDRYGRFTQSASRSSTMAFGRSPATKSTEQGLPSMLPSHGDVSDLEVATAEGSSGNAPDEKSQLQGYACTNNCSPTPVILALPSAVGGALNVVRDFVVHAKTGTVALWSNFQTSRDIRKRVKGGHQLTYAEHKHLERGADDRRKLLQYAVIYAISPQTFPYVVLYAPSLLPSTFEKPHAVRAKYKRLALERIAATLTGLFQIERQLLDADAKLKGKPRTPGARQTRRIEALETQREETLKILSTDSKKRAFELLQGHIVAAVPPTSGERRGSGADEQMDQGKKSSKSKKEKLPKACEGLPDPAAKALGKGMGLAGWRGIAPAFYARFMLNEYVKGLGKGDEVLRRRPLDSLSDYDLREACNARAIDIGDGERGGNAQALRNSLAEWLELTSAEGVAARRAGPGMVFLPDRARLLGLGLNFLENTRTGQRAELARKAVLRSW